MCASWNKDYDASIVLAKLEKSRSVNEHNEAAFEGSVFGTASPVLSSAVEFREPLPQLERVRIVNSGLFAAARTPLTTQSVLREISRLESDFLQRKPEEFVLVSGLSIRPTSFLPTRTLSG